MSQVNLRRLTVAASPEGTRQAIDEFAQFTAAHGLPDELRRRFQVALDEVLSNVARHGQPPDGRIDVAFEVRDDIVCVTVEDSAEAYNPLTAGPSDTSSPLEFRKAGGVGIEVVKGLLEDVRYEHVGGRNRLTMVDRVPRNPKHS